MTQPDRSSRRYLHACLLASSAAGTLVALATWLIHFTDSMHARGLLVFLLSLGTLAGALTGIFPALAGAMPATWHRLLPPAWACAAAGAVAVPLCMTAFLKAARAAGVPEGRGAVVALAFAVLATAPPLSWLLGSALHRITSRLRWTISRRVARAALVLYLAGLPLALAVLMFVPYRFESDGGVGSGSAAEPLTGTTHRPNVILISLDTVRPDHLSAYGHSRSTSPYLDRLISEGAIFTQAITSSSWTIPAHATLMTGASPSRIAPDLVAPLESGAVFLPESAVTLAEVLARHGYRTAGFIGGATMRSTHGFDQGFAHYDDLMPPSLPAISDYLPLAVEARLLSGLGRSRFLARLDPALLWICNRIYRQGHEPPSTAFVEHAAHPRRFFNSAREVNAKVEAWLERIERGPSGPFFLFVHYFDVHDPYDPPAPFAGRWAANPGGGLGFIMDNGTVRQVMEGSRTLSPDEARVLAYLYDEEIAALDDEVGRLMGQLRRAGLLENSVVVFYSDHGESLGDHGDLFHGHSLHEELIRIVLAIRAPGRVAAGARVERQVRAVDIAPTILDLSGIAPQTGGEALARSSEGVSLVPLLQGRGHLDRKGGEPAFGEVHGQDMGDAVFGRSRFVYLGVRFDGWKFVRRSDGGRLLYDLVNDPKEITNLTGLRAERESDLERRLDAWVAGGHRSAAFTPEVDPRRLDELRGLGYIEPPPARTKRSP
jgi:arylsulfatase A-like enzyme